MKSWCVSARRAVARHWQVGRAGQHFAQARALTDEEWVLMKSIHNMPMTCLHLLTICAAPLDIPYCHHEKWDGTGYPRGLKGEKFHWQRASLLLWMCGMRCDRIVLSQGWSDESA